MRVVWCCLAASLVAQAGVVRGIVQERVSGLPLARSIVRLLPVPKPGAGETRPLSVRAAGTGQFLFLDVPEGLYLLVAVRDGYFPAAYGQRRPTGQGIPVEVTRDSDLFTQLQMRRKGAITGRVLDENRVGITGVSVVAYRARLPLRSAARGVSDDRGVYRIHGLEPGKYWIRSASFTLDDGTGLLPTFGPESRESIQARVHQVVLDSDTLEADVRPEQGTLFRFGGGLQCPLGSPPVTVTLSSETGRKSTQSACGESYQFEGLAPAVYEVFAETQDRALSGFIELFVDRNGVNGTVRLAPAPKVDFEVRRADTSAIANFPVTVTGRRQDLAEVESERNIDLPQSTLTAGHWEMHAQAGPGQYIETMVSYRGQVRRSLRVERPPDWYDIFLEMFSQTRIRIMVSDKPAQIAGTVTSDSKSVPGVPVFLWPATEEARRSLRGWRQVLSDTEGHYRFDGLPPGDYRVLATFDFTEVDEDAIEEAHAATVRLDASRKATVDLSVWIAP